MPTNKNNLFPGIILGTVISTLIFCVFSFLQGNFHSTNREHGSHMLSENQKIKMFYETEVATNVSAHGLRKKIAKKNTDFILVDIRSSEEYDAGHIKGSVSIPAYTDKDNNGEVSKKRILKAFQKLDTSKELIMYCYSHYCMSSRKIGAFLADNGVYVKHLTVGWNEWRYNWKLWNYPHEKDKTLDFIGKNPFVNTGSGIVEGCSIEGEFSC